MVRSDSWTAMPKSVSSTWPSSASITFAGFTSRCTIPAACAASSASSSAAATRAACATDSGPYCSTCSSSVWPATSCITVHGTPSSTTTSCTATTFGWSRSRAALRASRSARRRRSSIGSGSGRQPDLLDRHLDASDSS